MEGGRRDQAHQQMHERIGLSSSQPLEVKEGEGEPEPGRRKAADDNLPYATNPVTSTWTDLSYE